jgi:antitoxin MazE
MTQLIKIGNYQGIRIPKALIDQAHLTGKKLNLQLVKDGILISPVANPRTHWAEIIQEIQAAHGVEMINTEWLDSPLLSDDDWNW